jgi:hypothetical protein
LLLAVVPGAIEREPEAGETEVTTANGDNLPTSFGFHPEVNHLSQTCSPLSAHPSTAQARTIEPEAARGARPIGF